MSRDLKIFCRISGGMFGLRALDVSVVGGGDRAFALGRRRRCVMVEVHEELCGHEECRVCCCEELGCEILHAREDVLGQGEVTKKNRFCDR
jgi:hypothetical protein